MLGPVEELLDRSRSDLSPAATGQLEVVNRNGLRLLRLVNTLLDFSRIEAGRVRAVYQPTDLAAFTAELASVFRAAIERAGLRLAVALNERGIECRVNTAAALMKAHGIRARTAKRFVRTTDSNHHLPVAENVLNRDFAADQPDKKWVADITYIPAREGWLFLARVADLFSRRTAGWAMDATRASRLVVDALEMAVSRRGPTAGLVAHSDRGAGTPANSTAGTCGVGGWRAA